MKAISIKQPWAWLIVNGYKDIENRSWNTAYRGRIYVHAGLKQDYDAYEGDPTHRYFEPYIWNKLTWDAIGDWGQLPISQHLGVIVGEVDIVDVITPTDAQRHDHESWKWWDRFQYGFVLMNPVAYETPIPCRGKLGFFEPNLVSKP